MCGVREEVIWTCEKGRWGVGEGGRGESLGVMASGNI